MMNLSQKLESGIDRIGHCVAHLWCAVAVILCLTTPTLAGQIDNTAQVSGTSPTGLAVSSPSATVSAFTAAASADVNMTATASLAPSGAATLAGDRVRLVVTAEHIGTTSISNPTITGLFNQSGRFLTADDAAVLLTGDVDGSGTLDAGETWEWEIFLTLTQAEIDDGSQITGSASFDGQAGVLAVSGAVSAPSGLVLAPDLAILKTARATSYSTIGEVLEWDVTVTNSGNLTAQSISVSDPLADSLVCATSGDDTIIALTPGASENCVARYAVTDADLASGSIDNTASASSSFLGVPLVVSDSASVGLQLTISGTLFNDSNGNASYDNGEIILSGYTVQLIDASGALVETVVTGGDGRYEFANLAPGVYTIFVLNPSGVATGQPLQIDPSQPTEAVDLLVPIDPSGVVYDAIDGRLLAGAVATLLDGDGRRLPDQCVLAGQQGQITGSDGFYRFDVVPNAASACPASRTTYQLQIDAPADYVDGVSRIRPPEPGTFNAGICPGDATSGPRCGISGSSTPPQSGQASRYFLAFRIGAGDADVIFNHVPLDPVGAVSSSGLTMVKSASRDALLRGESVEFTLRLSSAASGYLSAITLEDVLPTGFSYVEGSGRVDGQPITPRIEGQRVWFERLDIEPNSTLAVTFRALAGLRTPLGESTNRVRAISPRGERLTEDALATVLLRPEALFDCSDVIGRVFEDTNRNGIFDVGEGGIGNVRLITVTGTIVTADEFGRYSIPCAALPDAAIGSNFTVKLDETSLPAGYTVFTENPRVVRLTAGIAAQISFGVVPGRSIALELSDNAFAAGTDTMSDALVQGLQGLPNAIGSDTVVIDISYARAGEPIALARARIAAVRRRIDGLLVGTGGTTSYRIRILNSGTAQ